MEIERTFNLRNKQGCGLNTMASASSAIVAPASSEKVTGPVEVTFLNSKHEVPSGLNLKIFFG